MNARRPEDGYEYDPLTDPSPTAPPWGDPMPPGEQGSPWFGATDAPDAGHAHAPEAEVPQPQEWSGYRQYSGDDPEGYQRDWYAQPQPEAEPGAALYETVAIPQQMSGPIPVPDDETVALRTEDTRRAAQAPAGPGRAERRRAAKARGHRRPGPASAAPDTSATPAKPLTRRGPPRRACREGQPRRHREPRHR